MERPSLQQLANRIASVAHRFPAGEHYRHQSSGDVYQIVGHTIRESDGEPQISYRPVKFDGDRWNTIGNAPLSTLAFNRAASEWDENVEWFDGEKKRGGHRFIHVRKQETWTYV